MDKALKYLVFICLLMQISFSQTEKAKTENDFIVEAGLNYVEGYYKNDIERMKKSIHPELMKVNPVKISGVSEEILSKMGSSVLFGYAAVSKSKLINGQKVEVKVLDIHGSLASVKIISPDFIDFAQMAKINGEWKIINVLWTKNKSK